MHQESLDTSNINMLSDNNVAEMKHIFRNHQNLQWTKSIILDTYIHMCIWKLIFCGSKSKRAFLKITRKQ